MLPLVETKFDGESSQWPIESYDAKWQPASPEYQASALYYPAELATALADHVVAMARTAYRMLECCGFVTIDFRVSGDSPYLLEMNPNADLKPSTCLLDLLHLAGIQYIDFLRQMIGAAKERRAVLDYA